MIVRGTTPTIRFNLQNIDTSDIAAAYMTIAQNNATVIEKDLSQAVTGTGYIEFSLTQNDTLALDEKAIASVQLRCRNVLGDAYASKIYTFQPYDVLKETVI